MLDLWIKNGCAASSQLAGGKWSVQKAYRYIGTGVAGQCVIANGRINKHQLGRLVRMQG
jgi:N-acyl-D-aspartate/D-glutamate deacylase